MAKDTLVRVGLMLRLEFSLVVTILQRSRLFGTSLLISLDVATALDGNHTTDLLLFRDAFFEQSWYGSLT